ncbi:MAG: hypothetical protein J6A89_00430 [Clostridia bacterium]|nr:hypothetical protein [Clostridia bacterium]
MKNGIIIAGFKAIGKSTLAKKYENVVDLDSANYKYIIDSQMANIPEEQRKGLKTRIKNPDYPLNYYNAIIENCKNGKIVLIAGKKEMIDLLEKNNNEYYTVWPERKMLDEIIERCKKRGNNDDFVSNITNAYNRDYPSSDKNVIWMKQGEYLEDVLNKRNLLDV